MLKEELFYCTCCGACCRHIDTAVKNFKDLDIQLGGGILDTDFPYSWSESGVCSMLDENNKCKCYESRPLICNSAEIYKKLNSILPIDKDKFIELSLNSCNCLRNKDKDTGKVWIIRRKL